MLTAFIKNPLQQVDLVSVDTAYIDRSDTVLF